MRQIEPKKRLRRIKGSNKVNVVRATQHLIFIPDKIVRAVKAQGPEIFKIRTLTFSAELDGGRSERSPEE